VGDAHPDAQFSPEFNLVLDSILHIFIHSLTNDEVFREFDVDILLNVDVVDDHLDLPLHPHLVQSLLHDVHTQDSLVFDLENELVEDFLDLRELFKSFETSFSLFALLVQAFFELFLSKVSQVISF
jgi:hypothetical protein